MESLSKLFGKRLPQVNTLSLVSHRKYDGRDGLVTQDYPNSPFYSFVSWNSANQMCPLSTVNKNLEKTEDLIRYWWSVVCFYRDEALYCVGVE